MVELGSRDLILFVDMPPGVRLSYLGIMLLPATFCRELAESLKDTISANRLLLSPCSGSAAGLDILVKFATDLAFLMAVLLVFFCF